MLQIKRSLAGKRGDICSDLAMIQSLCQVLQISVNEFLCGQRLDDESFRGVADSNMITVLSEQKSYLRKKRVSDFLGGVGTGILLSGFGQPT